MQTIEPGRLPLEEEVEELVADLSKRLFDSGYGALEGICSEAAEAGKEAYWEDVEAVTAHFSRRILVVVKKLIEAGDLDSLQMANGIVDKLREEVQRISAPPDLENGSISPLVASGEATFVCSFDCRGRLVPLVVVFIVGLRSLVADNNPVASNRA